MLIILKIPVVTKSLKRTKKNKNPRFIVPAKALELHLCTAYTQVRPTVDSASCINFASQNVHDILNEKVDISNSSVPVRLDMIIDGISRNGLYPYMRTTPVL